MSDVERIYYGWEDFELDISRIYGEFNEGPKPYVVSVYKDSLAIGLKLSCIFKTPLSIIEIDGDNASWLKNLIEDKKEKVLVVDTILEDDKKVQAVQELLKDYENVQYCVLHNNTKERNGVDVLEKVAACRATRGEQIVYPWE